ncbi:MAG: hypothetical protein ACFHXK_04325 [bacterium]
MAQLLRCHKLLDEAEVMAQEIDDKDEQLRIRKGVLSGGGVLYTDVMMSIIAQYPDLDPDA